MITITVEERTLVENIITKSKICYVAMIDTKGFPYVIPMNFGLQGDILYLHSGPEGTSISSLEDNPNVCVLFCSDPSLIYQHEEVACSYRAKATSVMCRGKVVFETDLEQKAQALDVIMKQYTDRKFTYSQPAIANVKIWKVEIDDITTKIFGAENPKSKHYKGQDFSQYH